MEGEKRIESYSGEVLRAKANLQKRVIELSLLEDVNNYERVLEWIEGNSAKFAIWFDGRKNDPKFILRCTEDSDSVALEFLQMKEEGGDKEHPLAA